MEKFVYFTDERGSVIYIIPDGELLCIFKDGKENVYPCNYLSEREFIINNKTYTNVSFLSEMISEGKVFYPYNPGFSVLMRKIRKYADTKAKEFSNKYNLNFESIWIGDPRIRFKFDIDDMWFVGKMSNSYLCYLDDFKNGHFAKDCLVVFDLKNNRVRKVKAAEIISDEKHSKILQAVRNHDNSFKAVSQFNMTNPYFKMTNGEYVKVDNYEFL